jgi:hypothetical protein
MDSRLGRFWVIVLASIVVCATLLGAGVVHAANTPPIADSWNITSSGKAESSGELLFRVTPGVGSAPLEVTVFVLSGTNETGVASNIRRALSTRLGQRYNVEAGEGANVLLSGDRGTSGFSVELVESDVENVRVSVQSATPVAPPTVPPQRVPANSPATPATPPAPGDAIPPGTAPGDAESPAVPTPAPGPGPAAPSAPPASSSAPPASSSAPPASPSAPPPASSAPPAQPSQTPEAPGAPSGEVSPANGGAGAPASAPPPPPGTAS